MIPPECGEPPRCGGSCPEGYVCRLVGAWPSRGEPGVCRCVPADLAVGECSERCNPGECWCTCPEGMVCVNYSDNVCRCITEEEYYRLLGIDRVPTEGVVRVRVKDCLPWIIVHDECFSVIGEGCEEVRWSRPTPDRICMGVPFSDITIGEKAYRVYCIDGDIEISDGKVRVNCRYPKGSTDWDEINPEDVPSPEDCGFCFEEEKGVSGKMVAAVVAGVALGGIVAYLLLSKR